MALFLVLFGLVRAGAGHHVQSYFMFLNDGCAADLWNYCTILVSYIVFYKAGAFFGFSRSLRPRAKVLPGPNVT